MNPHPSSDAFQPAVLLGSPDAQTIFASLFRSGRTPPVRRERWDTPDGDFIDVDLLTPTSKAPHVMVLHGLEGSSRAGYVAAMFRAAERVGFGVCALNFRSCSGEPNRLLRSYHSGETEDALYAARRLRDRIAGPLCAVGFSLGANVLLRALAETGDGAPFVAAAAVSTPFDLGACARALDGGGRFASLYRHLFLRSLKAKALRKAKRYPGQLDVRQIRAARGIEDFDDVVTAPIHGFAGAKDYYARASSGPVLDRIRIPTLLINAADDPIVPGHTLPRIPDKPPLRVLFTRHGGHVGFVAGTPVRPEFWADTQVLRHFQQHAVDKRG